MIAQGKSIAHGSVSINYTTRLGKAEIVKLNHLPSDIEVQAFWAHMKAHQLLHLDKRDKGHPIRNDMIRIEISPERDDSKDWTLTQWRELLEQFVRAFDSADKNDPRFRGHKFYLANSQYLATLHRDSKSGILHMHLDCNRIDMDGELNDDYLIGSRAVFAANQVTRERGWIQAEQRAAENREQISNDCYAVLKDMNGFDWNEYVTRLTERGYDIQLHHDNDGNVRGYSVRMGNSIYKSSLLGHSRNLMPSKIEGTWAGLHPQTTDEIVKPDTETAQEPAKTDTKINIIRMKIGGNACEIRIPYDVAAEMGNEIRKMEADPKSDAFSHTAKAAALLFANFINEATNFAENCGGGGTSPSSGWGRDKDEDDLEWARRCARMAHDMITTRKRTYRR